ncbi:hypothetical protein [Stenotrophomonas sp. PS02289]|uniref:hypothetical protein n=1 Tax=Stenotrophomonas sp. PS02289 TaxID=2991422 RepID=UPI002499C2D5|nr:hypothetical protein [Stenotrophomonas sp. PS02289]
MNSPKLPVLIAGILFFTSTHAAPAEREGSYRVIPLAELNAPEEVKQRYRAEIARDQAKVKRVSNGEIPSIAEMSASLPELVSSSAELHSQLRSPPTDLQPTLLGAAELIGMQPSGALDGAGYTGLTRFYRLEGIGIVEFKEDHFRTPGRTITVIAEMQNARVNDVHARLDRVADSQGRSRATLNWAGENKLYTLTATGEGDVQRKAKVLQQIAGAVRD